MGLLSKETCTDKTVDSKKDYKFQSQGHLPVTCQFHAGWSKMNSNMDFFLFNLWAIQTRVWSRSGPCIKVKLPLA